MGGVDGVVFTGGIGENSISMRKRILQRLEFLGLNIDEDRNADVKLNDDNDLEVISEENSRVKCLVVRTNEELMIARETRVVLGSIEKAKQRKPEKIPIAISARHAHLDQETFSELFGKDAKLSHLKDLSQPGQFLSLIHI